MEYFIEGSPLLKFWWLESNIFKEILWYSIKSRSQCKIFIYILKEICFLWKYIIGPLDIIYLQGSHLVHIMMMVLYLFLDITTITFIHFSFFFANSIQTFLVLITTKKTLVYTWYTCIQKEIFGVSPDFCFCAHDQDQSYLTLQAVDAKTYIGRYLHIVYYTSTTTCLLLEKCWLRA